MKDRFIVCNDRGVDDPWVVYVTGEPLPNSENFDPREIGVKIRAEVEVDSSRISENRSLLAAVQAVSRLDTGNNGRGTFRRMLALVFQMGMAAQREIDKKARKTPNQDVANGSR